MTELELAIEQKILADKQHIYQQYHYNYIQ